MPIKSLNPERKSGEKTKCYILINQSILQDYMFINWKNTDETKDFIRKTTNQYCLQGIQILNWLRPQTEYNVECTKKPTQFLGRILPVLLLLLLKCRDNGRETKRGRDRQGKILYSLVYSLNVCNRMPGAKNSIWILTLL